MHQRRQERQPALDDAFAKIAAEKQAQEAERLGVLNIACDHLESMEGPAKDDVTKTISSKTEGVTRVAKVLAKVFAGSSDDSQMDCGAKMVHALYRCEELDPKGSSFNRLLARAQSITEKQPQETKAMIAGLNAINERVIKASEKGVLFKIFT